MSKDKYPFNRGKKNEPEPIVEAVYAGPEDMDEPIMEDVYGGPEWMGKGTPEGEPEEIDVPEETDEEKPEELPEKSDCAPPRPPFPPPQAQDPRMFMCVYAGPDYFSSNRSGIASGMFISQALLQPNDSQKYYCPECGTPVPEKAKFCPECGVKLPEVCASCGTRLTENSKFCPECGAKRPETEEKKL